MSELVDLISDGQMDGRQSVGGQTTDVIDVNGLSRPIGVTASMTSPNPILRVCTGSETSGTHGKK